MDEASSKTGSLARPADRESCRRQSSLRPSRFRSYALLTALVIAVAGIGGIAGGCFDPIFDRLFFEQVAEDEAPAPEAIIARLQPKVAPIHGQRWSVRGHSTAVACLAISPRGDRAISGGQDGMVRLWDIARGRQVHEFSGHVGAILAVAFLPETSTGVTIGEPTPQPTRGKLISCGADGTLRWWDAHTGQSIETVRVLQLPLRGDVPMDRANSNPANLSDLRSDPNEQFVSAAVDASSPPDSHSAPSLEFAAISPDGRWAVCGVGGACQFIDLVARQRATRPVRVPEIRAATFSPAGQSLLLVGGSSLSTLQLVDGIRWIEGASPVWLSPLGAITSATFTADGTQVLASTQTGPLVLLDANTGSEIQQIGLSPMRVLATGGVRDSGGMRDHACALCADSDGKLCQCDLETGEIGREIIPRGAPATIAAYLPGSQRIITGSTDGRLMLWDAR